MSNKKLQQKFQQVNLLRFLLTVEQMLPFTFIAIYRPVATPFTRITSRPIESICSLPKGIKLSQACVKSFVAKDGVIFQSYYEMWFSLCSLPDYIRFIFILPQHLNTIILCNSSCFAIIVEVSVKGKISLERKMPIKKPQHKEY